MRLYRHFAVLAAVAGMAMGQSGAAKAGFVLTIDDLGTAGVDFTYIDDVVDALPQPGAIVTSDFSLVGFSKPNIGPASLNLSGIVLRATGPATVQIKLTDTDFLLAGTQVAAAVSGVFFAPAGSSVTFEGFLDPDNFEFGTGGSVLGSVLLGAFGPGVMSDDETSVAFAALVEPFSLTQTVTVGFAPGGGTLTLDFVLEATGAAVAVPEPGLLSLFGTTLAGLGLARRRRSARR